MPPEQENQHENVGTILDRLIGIAEEHPRVTLGNVTEAFGHRSYGPFLMVPALIELTPIGGIPGVPTVLALIILIFAVQILIGRKDLWLPQFLLKRSVSAERFKSSAEKLKPIARWLDRWFHGRLPKLTSAPFVRVAAAITIALCLTVPPLELIPFASSIPMGAIAMFGLALLVRDGLLMLAGLALAAATVVFGVGMIGSGGGG